MRPANSIAESDMDGCSTMQQSQKHSLAAFCNLSLLILFIMNLALEKKMLGRSGLNSYPFSCGSGPALHPRFCFLCFMYELRNAMQVVIVHRNSPFTANSEDPGDCM